VFFPENGNAADATSALTFTVLLSNHKVADPNRGFLNLTIRDSITSKAKQDIVASSAIITQCCGGFVTNRNILYGHVPRNPFVANVVVFEKYAIVPFSQRDLCHIHYSP